MNERIKELADRAGEYVDFDTGICTDEFLQKLAELIIKDCSCVPTDMWGQGELDADLAVKVHRRILNHFGVEE